MASVSDIPIAPKLMKDWYKALADENCKVVMKLLTDDKRLLLEGWEADTEASDLFNLERLWKGRTPLHAAARRGDAELTKRVLEIYSEVPPGSKKSHLLEEIDGEYELNALAMAVVNGNGEIVSLLRSSSLDIPTTPYDMSHKEWEDKVARSTKHNDALEEICRDVVREVGGECSQIIKDEYYKDCDFNFLPFYVYLFHFTFSTWESTSEDLGKLMPKIREDILSRAMRKEEHWHYLLFDLWDGQGRTPLHVAVDSQKVKSFCELIPYDNKSIQEHVHTEILNKTDSAGRTPLYRAAAKNQLKAVKELLNDDRTKAGARITYKAYQWGTDVDIDNLSRKSGFKSDSVFILKERLMKKGIKHKSKAQAGPGPYVEPLNEVHSTALHVAIIHKHEQIVKRLLKHKGRKKDQIYDCERRFTWPALTVSEEGTTNYCERAVSTIKLAVLVGSVPILQQLLEAKDSKRTGCFLKKVEDEELPSFLLAAASGNPGVIKAFLDSENGKFDPSIHEDRFGNTALHHALKGRDIQFHPHLVDFAGCDHVLRWRWANSDWISPWLANPEVSSREPKYVSRNAKSDLEETYGKRMLSIDLLFQTGINIWEKDEHGRMASPEPHAPEKFLSWWYSKVAREMQQAQEKLNAAANAISVTGALVATASFVGPLQPPLGYDNSSGDVQVDILSVRVYVVSDSLSFFLALAAIILALIPSLPLGTRESMLSEMERTKYIVAVSVAFLLPSLLCVLIAFASGYIAVIPENGLARGGVAVATTVFGGSVVFAVILWFLFYMVWRKVLKPFFKLHQRKYRARARARTMRQKSLT